jgi:hypothetical protein
MQIAGEQYAKETVFRDTTILKIIDKYNSNFLLYWNWIKNCFTFKM